MKERRRCGEVRRCGLPRVGPGPASRCPDAGQLRRSPAFARTRRPGRCRVLVAADAPDERVSFGRAPDFFPGADSGTPNEALPRAVALHATRPDRLVGHVRASRWGPSSSRDSSAKRRGVEPVQVPRRHALEIALPHRRSLGRARRCCVSSTSRALRYGADRRLPPRSIALRPPELVRLAVASRRFVSDLVTAPWAGVLACCPGPVHRRSRTGTIAALDAS